MSERPQICLCDPSLEPLTCVLTRIPYAHARHRVYTPQLVTPSEGRGLVRIRIEFNSNIMSDATVVYPGVDALVFQKTLRTAALLLFKKVMAAAAAGSSRRLGSTPALNWAGMAGHSRSLASVTLPPSNSVDMIGRGLNYSQVLMNYFLTTSAPGVPPYKSEAQIAYDLNANDFDVVLPYSSRLLGPDSAAFVLDYVNRTLVGVNITVSWGWLKF
jgi:hypothetical protein